MIKTKVGICSADLAMWQSTAWLAAEPSFFPAVAESDHCSCSYMETADAAKYLNKVQFLYS